MNERQAQRVLTEIALQLVGIEDRLQRIQEELPESPDREAMWEHRVPYDIATEIHGTIECIRVDCLRPMIEQLEAAVRVTGLRLRRRFNAHT